MKLKILFTVVGLFIVSVFYLLSSEFNIINSNADEVSEEKGPDQRPYEWAYLKRTWPHMNADADAYTNALKQAHKLHSETRLNRLSRGLTAAQWEFAGPINVGGRVVDIEFDPYNPAILYSGFATRRVFKSPNIGVT